MTKLIRFSKALCPNPGWVKTSDPNIVIQNPNLETSIVKILWTKDDGTVLYDQVIVCERGGGAFLLIEGTKIGLQSKFRLQTQDLYEYQRLYPKINFDKLGRFSLEAPRGFGDKEDLSGLQTAIREFEEETGKSSQNVKFLMESCMNTAFNPHLSTCVVGNISEHSSNKHRCIHEKLLQMTKKVTFYELTEIHKLIDAGKLYCETTLGLIGAYLLKYLIADNPLLVQKNLKKLVY